MVAGITLQQGVLGVVFVFSASVKERGFGGLGGNRTGGRCTFLCVFPRYNLDEGRAVVVICGVASAPESMLLWCFGVLVTGSFCIVGSVCFLFARKEQ